MRETALEDVRQAIASGRLKPGSRVTERSLCESFGVSRTLAREIVRNLEAERLVDVVAHRGLRIATLTPQAVREIYAIRVELEVMVVRAFIETASDEDIAALRAIFDAVMADAASRNIPAILTDITRFLRHMIQVSGAQVSGEILERLLTRINMLRVYAMNMPGQMELSMSQLKQIVENIARRDAGAAETWVRAYVQAAGRAALEQLGAASYMR